MVHYIFNAKYRSLELSVVVELYLGLLRKPARCVLLQFFCCRALITFEMLINSEFDDNVNELESRSNKANQSKTNNMQTVEVESSRMSVALRTRFEVLGLEGQVLGLGLKASRPRKLPVLGSRTALLF